jgi:ribosomal protein S4E
MILVPFLRELDRQHILSVHPGFQFRFAMLASMKMPEVVDGSKCKVVSGAHKGKAGVVRDIHVSKSGAVTITVVQADGERFKTLAKNVEPV